jgi:hypothetical protein
MIRNRNFPDPMEVIKMMTSGENLPTRLDQPATDAERVEAYESVRRILEEKGTDGIRTLCIGCGNDVPILESAACECGGWVCAACEAREEDGVCDHEPHVLPEAVRQALEDDDDDDD